MSQWWKNGAVITEKLADKLASGNDDRDETEAFFLSSSSGEFTCSTDDIVSFGESVTFCRG